MTKMGKKLKLKWPQILDAKIRYDDKSKFYLFFWVENDISFCKNENYKFTISTLSRLRLLDYLYFISDRAIGTLIFFFSLSSYS